MKITISPDALKELRLFAQAYPRMVKAVVDESKDEVEEYILELLSEGTPVDTGKTKASWTSVRSKGGLSFRNPQPATPVLEKGLYPGVGPRTVQTSKGIFSTQAPEGIIAPIVENQKKIDTIKQIFTDALLDNIEKRLS